MPRYLTPTRIGLLVLVELYLSEDVASSARLNLLELIASPICAPSGTESSNQAKATDLASSDVAAFADALASLPSAIPGRTSYDIFLQRIWCFSGLNSLHELFDRSEQLVSQPAAEALPQKHRISRASPLGQFLRRCCIEFTRLHFAETQALWTAVAQFRDSTYDAWASKNPDAAQRALSNEDSVAGSSSVVPIASAAVALHTSAEDRERLLAFSIHRLQKLGGRIPHGVKAKLGEWISDQHDSGAQSLQHFMAFFEHWRSGQYSMALESLHQYFDYSLVAKTGSENMRVYYQYALLHLSVLHAEFECWEESVDSMNECIATARENQDTACLNFALSWLLYLRQARPKSKSSSYGAITGLVGQGDGDRDEIAFLKAKARETKHWSLLSSTLLEEARIDMHGSGSNTKPFECIVQSDYLSLQHDLRTLIPAAALFTGAAYERLGHYHSAVRCYESVTSVSAGDCPLSDVVRSTCRLAYGNALSGRYTTALAALEDLQVQVAGVLKLEHRVLGVTMLVHAIKCLRRDQQPEAEYHLAQLQPLREFGDPEIELEIQLLELDILVKRGDLQHALEITNEHLLRLKRATGSDLVQRLQFLVVKSKIFAASGRPAKGLSLALRVASVAEKHMVVPLLLEALALIATVLNDLQEFRAAHDLCQAALPLSFESRNVHLTARLFTCLAESFVGIAGFNCSSGSAEQSRSMRAGETCAERAGEIFARLDDTIGVLDCLAMKSLLARWRHDESSALQSDALYSQVFTTKDTEPV